MLSTNILKSTAQRRLGESSEGVQQGDPLASLFFALAIHPLLERLAAMRSPDGSPLLDLVQFYLDDGILCGSPELVSRALQTDGARLAESTLANQHRKENLADVSWLQRSKRVGGCSLTVPTRPSRCRAGFLARGPSSTTARPRRSCWPWWTASSRHLGPRSPDMKASRR